MSGTFYKETPVETKQGESMFLFCVYDVSGGSAFSCCTLQQGKRTEYESCGFGKWDVEQVAEQVRHYAEHNTGCEINNGFPSSIKIPFDFGDKRSPISPQRFSTLQDSLRMEIDKGLVTVATS